LTSDLSGPIAVRGFVAASHSDNQQQTGSNTVDRDEDTVIGIIAIDYSAVVGHFNVNRKARLRFFAG
jgi:hypothetical protein